MARQAPVQRRNGPYAPLSAYYYHDDAILALSAAENDLAEILFTRSLAYCAADPKRNGYISDLALQDGIVLRRRKQDRVIKAAQALVDVGIYVREDAGYRLRRWSKWNRTDVEIEAKRRADRVRKGLEPGDDDEPPPPEDRERFPEDSEQSPNGFHEDSAGNPNGVQAESLGVASRARGAGTEALQRSSTQFSATQRNAAAASPPNGGTTPLPPLSEPIQDLAGRIAAAGIHVSWVLDDEAQHVISQAIVRCGTHRLVKQAKAAYRPDNPAASAKAFIGGWASMPAPRAPDQGSEIPCHHGDPDTRHCALCRAEQEIAV